MALTLSVKDGGYFRVGDAVIRVQLLRHEDGRVRSSSRFSVTVDAPPTTVVLRDNLTDEARDALIDRARR